MNRKTLTEGLGERTYVQDDLNLTLPAGRYILNTDAVVGVYHRDKSNWDFVPRSNVLQFEMTKLLPYVFAGNGTGSKLLDVIQIDLYSAESVVIWPFVPHDFVRVVQDTSYIFDFIHSGSNAVAVWNVAASDMSGRNQPLLLEYYDLYYYCTIYRVTPE